MASQTLDVKEYMWSIRPCHMYKEEYDDCTSIKGRFQQYFIFGQSSDCSQWKTDYDNCQRFESNNDKKSGTDLVKSEAERRNQRMQAHYANDTWKKRDAPPAGWSSPLPEWMQKEHEVSYLGIKSKELKGEIVADKSTDASFCSIM